MAAITAAVIMAGTAAYSARQSHMAGKAGAASAATQAIYTAIDAGKSAGTRMYQAEQIREQAEAKADETLAAAKRFRSSQTVMAAASGFVVDSGTQQALMDETDKLARADTLAMMYDAINTTVGLEVTAENEIDSGVARGDLLSQKADAIYSQGQSAMYASLGQMMASGYSAYSKFNTPTTKLPATTNWDIDAGSGQRYTGIGG